MDELVFNRMPSGSDSKYTAMSFRLNVKIFNLLVETEGKRPLGRQRRRWVDNIKMDIREVGWDGRDWIDLAQDRDRWRAHVNAVMKRWEVLD
jgi:hypothetical protein